MVPIIPIAVGAAGVALLYLGKKEGATPATTGVSATPTTQSTGGAGGGATSPSHADSDNTSGLGGTETNTNVRGLQGIIDAAGDTGTPESKFGLTLGVGSAEALPTAVEAEDSWQQDSSPSLNTDKVKGYTDPNTGATGALGALTTIGGLSGKALADSFSNIYGGSIGAIW